MSMRPLIKPSITLAMGLLALLMFTPLLWMGVSSLKTKPEIYDDPFGLPETAQWDNYRQAWRLGAKTEQVERTLGTYAVNSIIVTAISVAGILLLGSMAAFAFSRLSFRGKELLYALLLLGLVIPVQAYVLPLHQLLRDLGLLGARSRLPALMALILPYIAFELPMAVFILRAFFDTLPRELDEAARMDGCTVFGVYGRIMLPLVAPALATVAIVTALAVWNEFLLAQWFVTDENFRTLPVGLNNFSGAHTQRDHLIIAALTMMTLPMLVVYLVFQRKIIAGLTAGAVKG